MLDGAVGLEGIIGGMEFLGGIVRYSIAVGPHALPVDKPHQRGMRPMGWVTTPRFT